MHRLMPTNLPSPPVRSHQPTAPRALLQHERHDRRHEHAPESEVWKSAPAFEHRKMYGRCRCRCQAGKDTTHLRRACSTGACRGGLSVEDGRRLGVGVLNANGVVRSIHRKENPARAAGCADGRELEHQRKLVPRRLQGMGEGRRARPVGAHAAIKGEDLGGGLRTAGGDSRDLSGARDTASSGRAAALVNLRDQRPLIEFVHGGA